MEKYLCLPNDYNIYAEAAACCPPAGVSARISRVVNQVDASTVVCDRNSGQN